MQKEEEKRRRESMERPEIYQRPSFGSGSKRSKEVNSKMMMMMMRKK